MIRFLVAMAFLVFTVPAFAQDQAEEEKSYFLSFVESQLSAPNRQIRISDIQGVLSSEAAIGSITVADNEGIWLRITNARIVWSRLALLRGNLSINTLAAERIDVIRKPLPDESLPSPESSGFRLPELPLSIILDELRVARVAFGEGIFGLQSEISVNGNLRLEGGSLQTALQITRLDGPGGRLNLTAGYANATQQLDLDLSLNEPANGILANLMNIEGHPPVTLSLTGSGPLSDLDLRLQMDADNERVLTGQMRFDRATDGLAFDSNLDGRIAVLVPPMFRDFFGDQTTLAANGIFRDSGGFTLESIALDGAAIAVKGSADTADDGFLRQLVVNATIADPSGNKVILPVKGGETTVDRASLDISFGTGGTPDWNGRLDISNLAMASIAAKDFSILMKGLAENLNNPAERSITFDVSGGMQGVTARRADIAKALGDRVDLAANGSWRANQPVKLDRASLAANGMSAALSGEIAEFAFNGDIDLSAESIAVFSALAGRDLAGALALKAKGRVEPVSGAFDLMLDGNASGMKLGIDAADRVLAGETRITGGLSRGEQGFRANNFKVENPQTVLNANGVFATGTADFDFDLMLSDLALLTEKASGKLLVKGGAKGADGTIALAVKADAPSATLAGRKLTDGTLSFNGNLIKDLLAGKISGLAFVDGARAELASDITAVGGERRLNNLEFTAGGTKLTGNLTQTPKGLFEGNLDLASTDVSTAAALLLVEATGRADAAISLRNDGTRQDATIKADIRNLRANNVAIGEATIEAAFQDILNVPAGDGSIRASNVSTSGVTISSLNANATQERTRTGFTADARLANGTTTDVRGALEPSGAGFLLSLDQLNLAQGQLAARLAQPAQITVEGSSVSFGDVIVNIGQGRVTLRGSVTDNINVSYAIESLPLSIANTVKPDLGLGGTISGNGRIAGPRGNPAGEFNLNGADLTARALQEAGLSPLTLRANGRFANQALALSSVNVDGPQGFTVAASGNVPLSGNGLDVNLNGSVPLALANRFLADRGARASGELTLSGTVTGSLANPSVRGMFSSQGAEFVDPETNVRVQRIALMGTMDGNVVTIRSLTAGLGQGGTVSATGTISTDAAANFPANIDIKLDRARYADGNMVVATVSGGISVTGPLTRDPLIAGQINVDRAEISIPESFGGSSALIDVEHVNTPPAVAQTLKRAKVDQRRVPTPTARPSIVRLDVNITAPNQIFVRGRGIDAELGGSVRLTGPVANIQPVGGFDLIRGRIGILGQRITFDEGQVTLVGDLDPMVHFVARSEGSDITAFVTVDGRVSDLRITFSSSPELPQDEVLARLIFNRSVGELSPLQIAQLAAAAAELAGGGANNSLLGSLRQGVGLDDLDIVTDSEGNAGVRAGRYIRDNIYLGVEAGAGGKTRGTVNLDITENLKAQGSVGSDGDSGLGIFYERDY
ncbi:MAG: translocation/assembly module TamB domain-containing protein [Phyllobacterium sp.]